MICRYCRKGIHPCPNRMYPRHLDRAPCSGWVHDTGGHVAGHLAEPAAVPPDRPAASPNAVAGPAASAPGSAAATPGEVRFAPVAGLPGTSSPSPERGGEEAQAPGGSATPEGTSPAGLQGEEWAAAVRKATADLHKAQRNRRGQWRPKGRNPFGEASGVRIPPPGGAA